MSIPPKVLSEKRSTKGLWTQYDIDKIRSPLKVSFMFNMSTNNVNLGHVRDKNFKLLYSPSKLCDADKAGYLKLSNTGKLEVYNFEKREQLVSTNFTGNHCHFCRLLQHFYNKKNNPIIL